MWVACVEFFTLQEQLLFVTIIQTHCVFQNSPEVDDEGYSIRPEDELEEEDILSTVFNTWQFLSSYLARTGLLHCLCRICCTLLGQFLSCM